MKRAEHQPETVSVTVYAGLFCKLYRVPEAGTLLPQHEHRFDHLTLVLQGSVRAWRGDDLLGDYLAPAMVQIPANAMHSFLTLQHGTCLACIHNADHLENDAPAIAAEHVIAMED